MARLVLSLLFVGVVLMPSCKKIAFDTGKSGDHKSPEETHAKADETQRPTDSGEGVPGYLLNRDRYAVTATAELTTVGAPEGSAVAVNDENSREVAVGAYAVPREELRKGKVSLSTRFLGRVRAARDGSFTIRIKDLRLDILVLTTVAAREDKLAVPAGTVERPKAVYSDPLGKSLFRALTPEAIKGKPALVESCAIGPINTIQGVILTPTIDFNVETCRCDMSKPLAADHGFHDAFDGEAHPCAVVIPNADEAANISVQYTQSPDTAGLCSPPEYSCNIAAGTFDEAKTIRSKGLIHAWKTAAERCTSFVQGGVTRAVKDVASSECGQVQRTFRVGTAIARVCFLDRGTHAAIVSACAAKVTSGCDLIGIEAQICGTAGTQWQINTTTGEIIQGTTLQ